MKEEYEWKVIQYGCDFFYLSRPSLLGFVFPPDEHGFFWELYT